MQKLKTLKFSYIDAFVNQVKQGPKQEQFFPLLFLILLKTFKLETKLLPSNKKNRTLTLDLKKYLRSYQCYEPFYCFLIFLFLRL